MAVVFATAGMGADGRPLLGRAGMFPNRMRGAALAVSGATNWVANFGATVTFLPLLSVRSSTMHHLRHDSQVRGYDLPSALALAIFGLRGAAVASVVLPHRHGWIAAGPSKSVSCGGRNNRSKASQQSFE